MRKSIYQSLLVFALVGSTPGLAQDALFNNGALLTIQPGATLAVLGNTTTNWYIYNYGTLYTTGNITADAIIGGPGRMVFNGTATQTLFSSFGSFVAGDVMVDNAAGITLATRLTVGNSLTLTSGIITAGNSDEPLTFGDFAVMATTPTDAAHVNGYVCKRGTGNFVYPVGNGTKYQPVTVNLSANSDGLTARYVSGNAGSGTFTSGGTETAPLTSYNQTEYWDLTPVTTATGTVTIAWDGTNDNFNYAVAARRVAHKSGTTWLNEGGTATGTTASGSVTSNSISTWSPFTLGSVGSLLPLRWTNVSGALNAAGHAALSWRVTEQDVSRYDVQKSGSTLR